MSYMQAEITDKRYWIVVDSAYGGGVFPADLINLSQLRKLLDSDSPDALYDAYALCKDYVEGGKVYSIDIRWGYGVRSSAPGYMDCTDWAVYSYKREALAAARQQQRECDGLE